MSGAFARDLLDEVVQGVMEDLAAGGRAAGSGPAPGPAHATLGPAILGPLCDSEAPLIRVGVSARHVHLSRRDLETLFGEGYSLSVLRELSQPGQFAAAEQVTLVSPKGTIPGVRILGPTRKESQVEVSATDAIGLGIQAPVRESGHLEGSPGLLLVGPKGSVMLERGVILAARHLHLHTQDARLLGIPNGARVALRSRGPRALIFLDVVARVSEDYLLEFHVDTDEANAAGLATGDWVDLVRADDGGATRP